MEKTTGAVNLLNLTAQAGLANLPNIGNKVQSTSDVSFSETFMKTSEVKPLENVTNEVNKGKTVVETQAGNRNIKTAEDVNRQDVKSYDEDKMKDVAEAVDEAIDEIKDKIKSQFEISDEDIENAMEVLGLTGQDLFDQTNLRSLVMELTGTTDSIELLTNVELYDGLKEVTTFAENVLSEVSEKLDIPQDMLKEIVNSDTFENALYGALNADEASDSEEILETAVLNQNSEASSEAKEIKSDDNLKVAAGVTDKTTAKEEKEERPIEVKVEVEKTEGTRTSNPIATIDSAKNNNSFENETGAKKQNLSDNTKGNEVNLTQAQTVTTETHTVGDVVETVTSYSNYADTENIMRQVTDYVRVNITDDVTKMEMQLHPASLGTVNMQINSQNGQITAHLTVQNELVKSVLESQMIKLQETFNEQGTKVTAIEVTVAQHDLNSNSDNNYSQERDNQQNGSKRRSINLNEIDSFDELTEEEILEAEVMEMNGSSVNYTA